MKNTNKAFTLIELMVVISIISFLSSVILSTVNNARVKAKDATIKTEMKQLAILMDLEYNEKKSYANLQTTNSTTNWINAAGSCSSAYTAGSYATKAIQICTIILNNVIPQTGLNAFYSDTQPLAGPVENDQKFSIMALLSTGQYYCVGSSGFSIDPGTINSTGCFYNP